MLKTSKRRTDQPLLRRPLIGATLAGTLGLLAWLQLPPGGHTARAQATDPGLGDDPVPHTEATPTPTPCPTPKVEVIWEKHAQLKGWACESGHPAPVTIPGSYTQRTTDPCKGDKDVPCQSDWVIVETTVDGYILQEVGSCGDEGSKTEPKKPDPCMCSGG